MKTIVSIITVTLNSENTIRDTIESVLFQNYPQIDYIIVDGLSGDKTTKIAEEYIPIFLEKGFKMRIISEHDRGLYDAMNKGIRLAQGEIIGILNSDDVYIDESVISKVKDIFEHKCADWIYADLVFVDKNDTNRVVRKWNAGIGKFENGWNPPHPTTFVKRSVYEEFGMYRTDFSISSDYDFLYRVHQENLKFEYLNEYLVKMRVGGKSTGSIKSNIQGSKEVYITLRENKAPHKLVTVLLRILCKIRQFEM